MTMPGRRRQAIFFSVLGIVTIVLTVALNISWAVLSWRTGVLFIFGAIVFLLVIAGMVLNTIFLVREIKKNEQHDAFLNAVTHELKTPVASIKLYLETLERRDIPEPKKQEFYRIMHDDTNRLMGTIEQVLEASRVGSRSGRGKQAVPLTDVVTDCVEMARVRHHLEEDRLHVERKLPTGDTAVVVGDPQELKSAVSNLVENAIKYSGGNVKVSLQLERLDARRVALRVADQGMGIPPAELKRIFGRFYRIPGVISQKIKGTGLGLFIVRSVARKHGGRVYAASEGAGLGSTFTMELESEFQPKGAVS
ncbi:MAG: HAMP domain-containing histidine kinase [Acidobacteria bacterium]|nr:HAMP domain-containing histidine kinase [Acidobacteriota bacterium]